MAKKSDYNRRDFLRSSAIAAAVSAFSGNSRIYAGETEKIRLGLIGCGHRGTSAVKNCIMAAEGVELVAMGDLFNDQLINSLENLQQWQSQNQNYANSINVSKEKCFIGFDAYKKVIASGIDIALLVTPPHFRPIHLAEAVKAGVNAFIEKPVAVDPAGVRSVLASAKLAKEKNLAIVSGAQRRHQKHYLELIDKLHNGAIGEILAGQCYYNMGDLWTARARQNYLNKERFSQSDIEYHCRNWLFHTWLSGDHIVEQHIHNIDIMNWALGTWPEKALGMGGRQSRIGKEYGNVYDHFCVEFQYPGGQKIMSMCRQVAGCTNRIGENFVGDKGKANSNDMVANIISDKNLSLGDSPNPYIQEQRDLINGIRLGRPVNEAEPLAYSTLSAIMGRISAYTGREISWNWVLNSSKLDYSPAAYDFVDLPEEFKTVAIPGQSALI